MLGAAFPRVMRRWLLAAAETLVKISSALGVPVFRKNSLSCFSGLWFWFR